MSQVSEQMALPSKPAPEYRQDPERVKVLLLCFKHCSPVTTIGNSIQRVTGYANVGALYEFSFSDQTRELLDGTAPDDVPTILAARESGRTWQTAREKHEATTAALEVAKRERDDARKDVSMWKDEAELMGRAAKRWAFYCAFALVGGATLGYLFAILSN